MAGSDRSAVDEWVRQFFRSHLRVDVSRFSSDERASALDHMLSIARADISARALADEVSREHTERTVSGPTLHDKQQLRLAALLWDAGKIADDEYLFYTASLVIQTHERRCLEDHYQAELRPICAQIDAIESDYGLEDGESWNVVEGPPEWRRLNDEYDEVLRRKCEATFFEYGLDDLGRMYRDRHEAFRAAYEAGRRSVHHRNDLRNAAAALVGIYENEARLAEIGGAIYSAIVMYAAACEARLLVVVLDYPDHARAAIDKFPARSRPKDDPTSWSLSQLIDVGTRAGWLRRIADDGAEIPACEWATDLRNARNLLHAGRHATERPHVTLSENSVRQMRSIYTLVGAELEDWTTLHAATL